jgi:Cdc6-like AAA superfamily ATPase
MRVPTGAPACRGREKQVRTLLQQLTKPTPDHIAVIGPKYIGKTVLLQHVAARLRAESNHYITTVHWDLRHEPGLTGANFRTRLAEEVARVLVPLRPDLEEEPNYQWLSVVLSILDDEGKRLLVVLDGLDRVLVAPGITRNLWDNLRALAQKRSLPLVTGSRRRLREICAGEDSRTSDFWEIFTRR